MSPIKSISPANFNHRSVPPVSTGYMTLRLPLGCRRLKPSEDVELS